MLGYLKTNGKMYQGLMLDAIPSAEIMEKKYMGLIEGAMLLIEELETELQKSNKKLMVNGLLQDGNLMIRIGKAADCCFVKANVHRMANSDLEKTQKQINGC